MSEKDKTPESTATTAEMEAQEGPVNGLERDQKIRSRAYDLFLEHGQEPGHELDDWLRAEQKIDGFSTVGSSITTSLGQTPRKIDIGALSLNVLESGAGEPELLFLHYWGGSARTWESVIARLCSRFRCIAYDQRGWGQSDAPGDGYALSDLAGDAAALIRKLDLRRYVLVGHSMGGKAAQLLAAQRPKGLEALILVAPASLLPQHISEAARQAQFHAYDNRETVLETIAFLTARPPDEATVEQIVEDSLGGSAAAKQAWPTSTAYEDISDRVAEIDVPTLILAGDQDRQDPLHQQQSEVLPRIPAARLQVVSDSGHLSPIDQPGQLAEAIIAFLFSKTTADTR